MQFPNRLYKYVWRNWDIVPEDRMAEAIGASATVVARIAASMGLVEKDEITPEVFLRNRYTIIRRNWDVIPKEQICKLLGITPKELADRLEDDFFEMKLGPKPACDPLLFDDSLIMPDSETEFIRNIVREQTETVVQKEPRFAFISGLCDPHNEVSFSQSREPVEDEVHIDSSWSIRLAGDVGQVAIEAARDLQKFLWNLTGVKVTYSRSGEGRPYPAPNTIELILEPMEGRLSLARGDEEAYVIDIEKGRVAVTASSDRGLMRGAYHLEKLMRQRGGPYLPLMHVANRPHLTPRIIFSYFTVYGDVFMGEEGDPYPEGYLSSLSHSGFNAVWLPAYLKDMVPSSVFPEFGAGSKTRLRNLNGLVERAAKYGMDVYLYLNEPRGMKEAFYEKHPNVKGHGPWEEARFYAMCTSTPEVKEFLEESTYRLFKSVPGLKGIITITASEHITNCYSKATKETINCPRCKEREASEIVAEILNIMNRAARSAKPDAEVIAWSWSWNFSIEPNPQPRLISLLDKEILLMTDFERGVMIDVGGVKAPIEEYCMSRSGPSQRVLDHRRITAERDMAFLAKIQISTTWECGSVPYIPVPNLMAEKLGALRRTGIDGVMNSWTLGSYPSINAEIAERYSWDVEPDAKAILREMATRDYGEGAPLALAAWEAFSQGFSMFPFSNEFLYTSPIQFGSSYQLSLEPSRVSVGLFRPGEGFRTWTSPFGPERAVESLDAMAAKWDDGLTYLEKACALVPESNKPRVLRDLGVARAIRLIFRATRNAICFLDRREKLLGNPPAEERRELWKEIRAIVKEEIRNAEEFHRLVSADSRLGFEACMQYFYRPLDILENLVGCHQILKGYESSKEGN